MTLSLYTVKTIQVTGTVEISADLVQRFVQRTPYRIRRLTVIQKNILKWLPHLRKTHLQAPVKNAKLFLGLWEVLVLLELVS